MLSAIVVSVQTGRPGDRFFDTARFLEVLGECEDEESFGKCEIGQVWARQQRSQRPDECRSVPDHTVSERRPSLSNSATTESRSAAASLTARVASSDVASGQSPGFLPLGKLREIGMSGMDRPAVGKTIAENTKVMAEVEWESSALQYQASRALPVGQRSARSDGIRPVLDLKASPHQVLKVLIVIEKHPCTHHAAIVALERTAELGVGHQPESATDSREVVDHSATGVIGPEEHRLVTGDGQGKVPVSQGSLRITRIGQPDQIVPVPRKPAPS